MDMYLNKNQLVDFFRNHPCEIVETTGTREGMILKFKTFYLKIYNTNADYLAQIYRYGCNVPCQVDEVNKNKIREYVSQIIE